MAKKKVSLTTLDQKIAKVRKQKKVEQDDTEKIEEPQSESEAEEEDSPSSLSSEEEQHIGIQIIC